MSKFKQTIKIIEEGLLKPMSDTDIERVESEALQEWESKLKSEIIDKIKARSETIDDFINQFSKDIRDILSDDIYNAIKTSDMSSGNVELVDLKSMSEDVSDFFADIPESYDSFMLDETTHIYVLVQETLILVSIDDFTKFRAYFLLADFKKLDKFKSEN